MTQLPVIISMPHGGITVPDELRDRICLNPDAMMNQSLYLMARGSERDALRPDPVCVRQVREKFERALRLFFGVE